MTNENPKRPRRGSGSLIATLVVAALLLARQFGFLDTGAATLEPQAPQGRSQDRSAVLTSDGVALLEECFRNQTSDVVLEVSGSVQATLPDDLEGSRHQRFILRLSNGRTVLVAHNIDLAKKVPLSKGDQLRLKGEYEYNDKGGVLHWTHLDPRNRHEHGWILHKGVTYE